MEVVGGLVGLDPYQARLDEVDRLPQRLGADSLHILREVLLPQRQGPLAEPPRAPDLVLPQPALALVDTQTVGFTGELEVEVAPAPLLVSPMTGLVHRAVERAERVGLAVTRRPANIVRVRPTAERVGRCVAATGTEVEADGFGNALAKSLLSGLPPGISLYPRHVGPVTALNDRLDQGRHVFTQSSEQRVNSGYRQTTFVEVEQRIVAQLVVAQVVRLLAGEVDCLGEIVAEDGEVVFGSRLGPRYLRLRAVLGHLGYELGGQFGGLVI